MLRILFHGGPEWRSAGALIALSIILMIAVPEALAQNAGRAKKKTRATTATKSAAGESAAGDDSKQDPKEAKNLNDSAKESRANLLGASTAYRESLEKLLELQHKDESRAVETVEKRKELLAQGVIARRELEEGERILADAQSKITATTKQIAEVDQLIAEINTAEELAQASDSKPGLHSGGMLIRYVGSSRWMLSDVTKVEAFYSLKFSKPLPLSAFGQTATHDQLGFDHREAVDVAVHPDSVEGKALIAYLTSQGISFIAIRGAIPGSATGAHIHIGPPSKRISH